MNRILVVTQSTADADILTDALGKAKDGPFEIECVTRLSTALDLLAKEGIDAILVDLSLPDSDGIDTFDRLFAAVPHTPIMTLSGSDEEDLARIAVEHGAQGFLSKGNFRNNLVPQSLRSVIQRKGVEEALHWEKARAEITLNSISDAVIRTDTSGNVDYLNAAAEKITGWQREQAYGHPIAEVLNIVNGDTREVEPDPIQAALDQDKPTSLSPNTVLLRRDGGEIPIEDSAAPIHDWGGHIAGAVIVFRDVSTERDMTQKLAHLAQHDFLTDLPNRLLLNDRIAHEIAVAKRRGTQFALLFLDLDGFRTINNSFGHGTGDMLLRSVSGRLNECVRGSDTISRLGGDEFVILLSESDSDEGPGLVAAKILSALAIPHAVDAAKLKITGSIGISVYPVDGEDAEALIENADTAMYDAKKKGRNNFQFFTEDMNIRMVERQAVEASLRHALENEEFVLHYQPKVNLGTRAITGVEALLRWNHPEWGMVLPARFVPVAEDCGLILPIGRWVLREACMQAKRWMIAGLRHVLISVNISALEFGQKDFVAAVREILAEAGLPPQWLQLEITESVLMRDAEANSAILKQLKDIGVQLAVYDLCTGYYSLSYLTKFPIDVLKIDQSFVSDIQSSSHDGIIASAVIGMGISMKLRVIAEGIENQMQLAFLKAHKCEEGQGYLFSRPVGADMLAGLLADGLPVMAA